jgi:hypothetical protein
LCDFSFHPILGEHIRKDGKMETRTDYPSSAASLFAVNAREAQPIVMMDVRYCEICGLTYACQPGSALSGCCPMCSNTHLAATTTRETIPGKWSEYLDAYIGQCLVDGAEWVPVAQHKAPECCCFELAGDNPHCPVHKYLGGQ